MTTQTRALRTPSPRTATLTAVAALVLLWGWLYGRFVGRLFFALDDWIETEVALAQPLAAVVGDSFSGALLWSGYRPLTYALRALFVHLFGLEAMAGYAAVSLGLHLVNTLLTFHLVRRVAGGARGTAWAFVAAAILLLLPAHNEAVLYFSASANLFALFFALLALEAALTAILSAQSRRAAWAQAATVAAVAAALLSYEILVTLPLLILLADWGLGRATVRRRLPMYAAMVVVVAIALALRAWAGSGQIGAQRSDYALSPNPAVVGRGYAVFLGQMVLLHTSAWPHIPLFSNVREWISPLNLRALASIGLAAALSAVTLFVALRAPEHPEGRTRRGPGAPFWMLWGVIWILLTSLPFAALAGRLPENRYTLIPSFGMAVAVAALVAWLYERARAPALRALVASGAVALLAFYAYVDTSDVAEWERAAGHARSFLAGMATEMPLAAPAATLAQVGVPGNVGTAYVFTTDDAFAAAIRLSTGGVTSGAPAGDLALRDLLEQDAAAADRTVLLGYDRDALETRRIAQAWFCDDTQSCSSVTFAQPDPTSANPAWSYLQLFDPETARGYGMLLDATEPPTLRSCWAFADLTRIVVDPTLLDAATTNAHCATALDALLASGALAAPTP